MKNLSVFVTLLLTSVFVLGSCDKEQVDDPNPAKPIYYYSLSLSVTYSPDEDPETKTFIFDLDSLVAYTIPTDSDRIVLYNNTKGVFACDTAGNCIYLKPFVKDDNLDWLFIDQDSVTFCKYNESADNWESVKVDPTDKYSVYYQINNIDTKEPAKSSFSFRNQVGDASDMSDLDFFQATDVTLSMDGNRLFCDEVSLEPLTTKMCISFKYVNRDGDSIAAPVSVEDIMVLTTYETLVGDYYPTRDHYETLPVLATSLDDNGCLMITILTYYHPLLPEDTIDRIFVEMQGLDADGHLVEFLGHIEQPKGGYERGYFEDIEIVLVEGTGLAYT